MIHVLVTASAGDIGQGVIKSLKISSYQNQIKLFTTDINEYASGLFMGDIGHIVEAAKHNSEKYIEQITEICTRDEIDIVFVCNETEQLIIAQNKSKFDKALKTYFVVQPLKTIEVSRDKLNCQKYLFQAGIRYPESCVGEKNILALAHKYGYPIICKPLSGYGGLGKFKVINNKNELDKYIEDNGIQRTLCQEYIINDGDEEYTVGVFLDNTSKALGAIPMLRRLKFSMSWHGIVDSYPDIIETAIKTAQAVKAIGPCNIQIRRDKDDQPCVIEINSRISGTTAFRALLGFNEAEASIDYFLNNKNPDLRYESKMVAMKIWDEMIVPLSKFNELKSTGRTGRL